MRSKSPGFWLIEGIGTLLALIGLATLLDDVLRSHGFGNSTWALTFGAGLFINFVGLLIGEETPAKTIK